MSKIEGKDSFWHKISLQQSYSDLIKVRQYKDGMKQTVFKDESTKTPVADREDLLMIDGYRIIALAWLLMFGSAQFTMGGLAYNPWNL